MRRGKFNQFLDVVRANYEETSGDSRFIVALEEYNGSGRWNEGHFYFIGNSIKQWVLHNSE